MEEKRRTVRKAEALLAQHEAALIKELGPSAFTLLTPRQAAGELGVPVPRISDLVRQGWLAAAPDQDVGHAHQYYRWRVEFVKRHKTMYQAKGEEDKIPP